MTKRSKLTKTMLRKLDKSELRIIAITGMGQDMLDAYQLKGEGLVDWVHSRPGEFADFNVDGIDNESFREGITDYVKAIQRMLTGEGSIPSWPTIPNAQEEVVEEPTLEKEVVETKEMTEVASTDVIEIPEEYLTKAGKPDLRKKAVRELLGKPALKRTRKTTILSPKKVQLEVPEKELRESDINVASQLKAELSAIEQKLGQAEERFEGIENALLFILNVGREFLDSCTTLDGYPVYENMNGIPKPVDYLDDDTDSDM